MSGVTPTFDFEADAVPTRELLLRQARSLQIDLADLGLIDTQFLKVRAGDETGTTGADTSTVGEMWMSPGEQLFVDFGDGPVVVWNPDGWWETNRYNLRDDGHGQKRRGYGVRFLGSEGGTTENGVRWFLQADGFEGGGLVNGLLNESAFSGHCRVLGHGPAMYGLDPGLDFATLILYTHFQQVRVIGNAPSANFWHLPFLGQGGQYQGWIGYASGLAPNSSAYSSAISNERFENAFYGHFSGTRIIGPGDTV
jgi:hypothetical protein